MSKLLIYTAPQTSRIRYTFDFIFNRFLQLDFEITSDKEEFLSAEEGPKISYTNQPLGEELFFYSTPLLFEKGIRTQQLKVFDYEGVKAFFATNKQSALPFDPFAATFYMLSRYEEYLPYQPDQLGRYPASESLAYENDFLQTPVVDHWGYFIQEQLEQHYPQLDIPKRDYQFLPTYDIDSAYAYKHKGVLRTVGGFVKSLYQKDWKAVKDRAKVVFRKKEDPYDTFDWLHVKHQEYDLTPLYFFLVGDYGEYDRNISPNNHAFRSLIKSTGDYAQVGLHSSYASNEDPDLLRTEHQRLEEILRRDVYQNRQHFLKLTLPRTYQALINLEIKEDYTMGYASQPGFRAGTCTPFPFFDLDYEASSDLVIYPFAIMDATLKHYLKSSPEEAIVTNEKIIEAIKNVNGTFISLWHNSSLCEQKEWDGWSPVYENLLKMAT